MITVLTVTAWVSISLVMCAIGLDYAERSKPNWEYI